MPVQATPAPTPGQFRAYISALKGRQLGAFKGAAKKIGVTLDDYIDALDAGRKWCFACSQWRDRCHFSIDRTRWTNQQAANTAQISAAPAIGP